MIYNLPTQYTRWNEVFQNELGQEVGFARETTEFTAAAGVYEIGTLVVYDVATKASTLPAATADLVAALAANGKLVGILAGKDVRLDCVGGINADIVELTATYASEPNAVVVVEGRNGGAVGKAELKFPADATATTKEAVLRSMREKQGFKFLNQQVKG